MELLRTKLEAFTKHHNGNSPLFVNHENSSHFSIAIILIKFLLVPASAILVSDNWKQIIIHAQPDR